MAKTAPDPIGADQIPKLYYYGGNCLYGTARCQANTLTIDAIADLSTTTKEVSSWELGLVLKHQEFAVDDLILQKEFRAGF